MNYVELQVTSNFSFLRGASHPEEIIELAAALGHTSIAITDRNTLAGVVRAHVAAKKKGLRLIVGCRLDLLDGPSLLAYPTDRAAYARISALLTEGNMRAEKGSCYLYKADVYKYAAGSKFIIVPPEKLNKTMHLDQAFEKNVHEYKKKLGDHIYLGVSRSYRANDSKILALLTVLSHKESIPLVALNDVHYHSHERRELQDVITCIREKCTIYNAGFKLHQNSERHLKEVPEMMRLFKMCPDAIRRTGEIADACKFSLDSLKYEYPDELTTNGRTPQQELTYLAWKGAKQIYGAVLPDKVVASIKHELRFVKEMNYAHYFLTVYDIIRFARSQNILCQGRGSAANSTVCFCLGITSVDPTKFDLLFERFISSARNEPPDIDVDFEHERREEVIQYIFNKYGRDRCAIVATVTQLHQKGAIRDVAKVFGMSEDAINHLSDSIWEFTDEWFDSDKLSAQGFNPKDPQLIKILALTKQYMGFPRQLGQHTGGFVITRKKLTDLCPILNARMEDRTCIEWNKDDIDALGILKVDVLALGMLTCIRKAFNLARDHYDMDITLANIPHDDPAVYHMIQQADTIGVFQIESRAQQSMLPRLKPENFYDLVIEVAIVRPGPIQGDMVHPYLRRRNGLEPVEYPSKELEEILYRTKGVPLFQEQAMKIAIVAAGFTPAEADELRRSMATFKAKGMVSQLEKKLIDGMIANGYSEDFAKRIFRQLEGFGSYGFPESHAASFAHLVYISSWLKCYFPDIFLAALLNSQPMGFYRPAQLVADAIKHHVDVLPPDINYSSWDSQLETITGAFYAVRLGFREINSIGKEDMQRLVDNRRQPYATIHSLRDTGVSFDALEKLADADAFRSLGMDRRKALWEVAALSDRPLGLFIGQPAESAFEAPVQLPEMSEGEHVVQDYSSMGLSLKAHPVSFVRDQLQQKHIIPTAKLTELYNGAYVKVAGLVLVRQRPGTAGGICFITIEDETGTANLVVFKNLFEVFRKEILFSRLLMVEGRVQREGDVIHVIVKRCHDYTSHLQHMFRSADDELPRKIISHADEKDGGSFKPPHEKEKKVVQAEIFPKGRNFR